MSDQQKLLATTPQPSERYAAGLSVLSPLVLEALRARGLSDDAINAVMRKRKRRRSGSPVGVVREGGLLSGGQPGEA